MNDDGSSGKACLGKIEFFINITKEIDELSLYDSHQEPENMEIPLLKKIAYIQLGIQSNNVVNLRLEQPDKPGRIPEQWKKKTGKLAAATVQPNSNTPLKKPPISIIYHANMKFHISTVRSRPSTAFASIILSPRSRHPTLSRSSS